MSESAPPRAGRPWLRRCLRFVPLALIAAGAAAAFATDWYEKLALPALLAERDTLTAFVAAHRPAALALFASIYTLAVALSIPGASLCTVAGGFLFGGIVGGATAAVAATLGASAIFLAARTSVGDLLREKFSTTLAKLSQKFETNAASYLLFLRLTPVFPFWIVNLGIATLLDVRLSVFVWTTFIGILPASFALAFAGAGIDSIIESRRRVYEACVAAGQPKCDWGLSVSSLITYDLMLAFAVLGAAALVPVIVKGWRQRRRRRHG